MTTCKALTGSAMKALNFKKKFWRQCIRLLGRDYAEFPWTLKPVTSPPKSRYSVLHSCEDDINCSFILIHTGIAARCKNWKKECA